MGKVAIATDTSCMTAEEGKERNVFVLPMPFTIDGVEYLEGVDLDKKLFGEKLASEAEISTSQPSAGAVMDFWDDILKEYDEIVYIPISSGLSGSYANACVYAEDYEGKVEVVDAQRVSVTLHASVEDAITLRDMGLGAKAIREALEAEQANAMVYIAVDNLYRLKKGGRITPMAAAIGSLLKIRPVLKLGGDKLDALAKVRSVSRAKQTVIRALETTMRDMDVHTPSEVRVQAACTCGFEGKDQWVEELSEAFPEFEIEYMDLPMNLSCHVGTGGIGGAVTKRMDFSRFQ